LFAGRRNAKKAQAEACAEIHDRVKILYCNHERSVSSADNSNILMTGVDDVGHVQLLLS
jgi:hypothetical protein